MVSGMRYGELPLNLGIHPVDIQEMMFYQYLPVKLSGQLGVNCERRLKPFWKIIKLAVNHYINTRGKEDYTNSYIYVTAKNLFVNPNGGFNRPGWHSDGYLTDDINYIWSNRFPTVFNTSKFELSLGHEESIQQMQRQAYEWNDRVYKESSLLMLNQYNIHRCAKITEPGMRAFLKISFSKEKYNLVGNSHKYELDYKWDMKPRKIERNHPIA